MVGLQPVVDDPDLHPVAGGFEVRSPKLVGADLLRPAGVSKRVVAHVGPDTVDARARCESAATLDAGHHDGEPVDDVGVPPAHLRARHLARDPVRELVLGGAQLDR